jgi:hypothetical protein
MIHRVEKACIDFVYNQYAGSETLIINAFTGIQLCVENYTGSVDSAEPDST